MEWPYDIKKELNLLEPKHIHLCLNEFEKLTLVLEGGIVHKSVTPLCVFPITAIDRFIILKSKDGNELGMIQNIIDLDLNSRKALTGKIERIYAICKIIQINDINPPIWDVEIEQGERVFEAKNIQQGIGLLNPGRVVIWDIYGNRYEIPDYRRLDPCSRVLVDCQI